MPNIVMQDDGTVTLGPDVIAKVERREDGWYFKFKENEWQGPYVSREVTQDWVNYRLKTLNVPDEWLKEDEPH